MSSSLVSGSIFKPSVGHAQPDIHHTSLLGIAVDAVNDGDQPVDRIWIGGWNGNDNGIWSDGSAFAGFKNWAPDEPNYEQAERDDDNNVALFLSPDPYSGPLYKKWTAHAAKAKLNGVVCKRRVPIAGKFVPQ